MVVPTAGVVVLIRFPFSDLSGTELRPAVVVADAGRDDWILCQVTSNRYADTKAVSLTAGDFRRGELRIVSYARPGKLFTASRDLMVDEVGQLKEASLHRIVDAIIDLLRETDR